MDKHTLIDKKRIMLNIGDKLKINDVITSLIIDYDLNLLEVIYFKGFNENNSNYFKDRCRAINFIEREQEE